MRFRLLSKKAANVSLILAISAGVALSAAHLPNAEASTGKCSGINDSQVTHEINQIQGSGAESPLVGKSVTTCGTVYAVEAKGYWIQDTTPDSDPATSEGIFVYKSNGVGNIKIGDIVRQKGYVQEYYGLTEINAKAEITKLGTGTVPAAAEITASMTYSNLESLEGMRVFVKSATVVAGTNKYNETFVVPGSTASRVARTDTKTPLFKFDDVFGNVFTDASTFDTISGDPAGPLTYSFGAYGLLMNTGTASVSDTGNTQNSLSADSSSQFTTATFNVENYFAVGSEVSPGDPGTKVTQQQFDTKTAKLSLAIRNSIGSPDVAAVQEVEKIEVLNALASKIASDGGPNYTAYLIEGSDERGIDNAYLVKEGTTVLSVEQKGKDATTTLEGCGPSNTNLLFSRPPLVLRVQTAAGQKIALINNHFKSRGGDDPENKEFQSCREAQAEYVANVANAEASNGYDVIVLGDLNSFPEENVLAILQTNANLTNLVQNIPSDRAFSYIYTGRAQFLDHLLVGGALKTQATGTDSAKINPDHPYSLETDASTPLHVSDHDPIRADF
ncbi:endonuclease/exonuclease/phosphatase family protein [Paenibacillus alkalitolerans]|uniref:endonuclease/exonuclease/phosphatase family protein n=1 Tax=Paenibacillus alkalitolerans TaxID=2799335 RepID=UPI0018F3EF53|nr:endonuclease/exonuclease/phosphatase family protein [Paenibacillus alkalitolerans]